jgi:NAD-dependent DNA ligase
MNKLEQYLNLASRAYYSGAPIISDDQFDRLAESIGYNAVGAKQHGNVERHVYQMYSLQKYYEDEDQKRPLDGITNIVATAKLDGAAISLLYVDGKLVRALTRGDGIEGQLITDKILSHKGLVPHTIALTGIIQITGEIVAPSHIENSRNYAAGSLNLKDSSEFSTRALSFFAYGSQPCITTSYRQDLNILKEYGFGVISEADLDKVYPCDGLVFRVNDNQLFQEMGYTSKHPRGAYAKKERQAHVETTLLSVEWQVGKSGKVTPVAILDPVYIGDALVSRATLNNPGFIEMLDLQIGDRVAVIRSGEIIPCILHKVDA